MKTPQMIPIMLVLFTMNELLYLRKVNIKSIHLLGILKVRMPKEYVQINKTWILLLHLQPQCSA
jgi:hypothetical protein